MVVADEVALAPPNSPLGAVVLPVGKVKGLLMVLVEGGGALLPLNEPSKLGVVLTKNPPEGAVVITEGATLPPPNSPPEAVVVLVEEDVLIPPGKPPEASVAAEDGVAPPLRELLVFVSREDE